jgi:hypothetical protein
MTPKEKITIPPQEAVSNMFDAMDIAVENVREGIPEPGVVGGIAAEYKGPEDGYTIYLSDDHQIK